MKGYIKHIKTGLSKKLEEQLNYRYDKFVEINSCKLSKQELQYDMDDVKENMK